MPEGTPLSITIHIHHQISLNHLLHLQGRKTCGWDSWWRAQVGNEHAPRDQELTFRFVLLRAWKEPNKTSRLQVWPVGMISYLILWPSASRRRQFTIPKIPEFPQLVAVNHTGCSDESAKISYRTNSRLFYMEPQKEMSLVSSRQRWISCISSQNNWTNTNSFSFFPPTISFSPLITLLN